MVVKLVVSVIMLPVALAATVFLELICLLWLAGALVLGIPIVILAAMFGGKLSDELSEMLGTIWEAMVIAPGAVFGKMYGNVWD
ncbi:hypothetical protein ACIP4Q_37100 [Streptomyces massasporeus]